MSEDKKRLKVLTNSRIKAFRRCQHEHWLTYELGYRPVQDEDALVFGTLMHGALEVYWKGGSAAEIVAFINEHAATPMDAVKATVLMSGYISRWEDDDKNTRATPEVEFETPLVNPETCRPSRTFVRKGKIDVLLDDAYIEHKSTTADIGTGSTYWKRLILDSQVSTYFAGAKSLGVNASRCIYDVIRKPSIRTREVPVIEDGAKVVIDASGQRVRTKDGKKWRETPDAANGYTAVTRPETLEEFEQRLVTEVSENPDKYYQRGDVVRLEQELVEADMDVWHLAQSMHESLAKGRHPKNPDACERYGRFCGFFDVCTGAASLDDPERFIKSDNVNPELSADVAG